MKIIFSLLTVLFMSFYQSAHAGQCLMVSGIKKDWNGAFSQQEWQKLDAGEAVIAGRKCTRINSWSEVDQALKKMKLGKNEDLFIVQGAHGGDGGSMTCNLGDIIEGDVVYGKIKQLAQTRKLGVYVQSCHSGDLMKHKLLDDLLDPGRATDNLCLWPITSFNNNNDTDVVKHVMAIKPGQSMSEVYQSVPQAYIGLFSGSLWSDWGLDVHFLKQDQASLVKAWQGLKNIMSRCEGGDLFHDMYLKLPNLPKEMLEAILSLQKYDDEAPLINQPDLARLIEELENSKASGILKKCQQDLAGSLRQTQLLQRMQRQNPNGYQYVESVLYKYEQQSSADPSARGIVFRDIVNGIFRFAEARPECGGKDWAELSQKLNLEAIAHQATYGQNYFSALKRLAGFVPAQETIKSATDNPHQWSYLLQNTLNGLNRDAGTYGHTGAMLTESMVDKNHPDRKFSTDVRLIMQTVSKHSAGFTPKSDLDKRRRKACDNFVF